MKISMIAAIGEGNRVLGKDNKLLWDIPEDMQFFREKTKGCTVIMGRKTYESIGKPLPKRVNIVVTRDKTYKPEGVVAVHSLEEALSYAKNNELEIMNKKREVFIIGGGEIYTQGLAIADRLYLTIVHDHFDGDAFFPEYSSFRKVVSERKSEGNGYQYTFLTLEKE